MTQNKPDKKPAVKEVNKHGEERWEQYPSTYAGLNKAVQKKEYEDANKGDKEDSD